MGSNSEPYDEVSRSLQYKDVNVLRTSETVIGLKGTLRVLGEGVAEESFI
jgi:hypothetical protein